MNGEPLYPVFLKLGGRRVLVVGGGRVAASRLPSLLDAQARVVAVAPHVHPDLRRPGVTVHERMFEESDLDDAWFVVAAATPDVNRRVAAAAAGRRLFVNAVDDRQQASAYAPALVRRGDVVLALSTGGRAPALAGLLREGLAALLPEDLDDWIEQAASLRERQRAHGVAFERRRPALLAALTRLYGDAATGTGS